MERHCVLRWFLWLGMLTGRVGLALLGRMRRPRFGRMRVTLWDERMCHFGWGDHGCPGQRNANGQSLSQQAIFRQTASGALAGP
jgi:hypothetical protein